MGPRLHTSRTGSSAEITSRSRLAGNWTHRPNNPLLVGPVTFNFALTGMSFAPEVSSVVFAFGDPIEVGALATAPVPEPQSLALVSPGLTATGWNLRRQRSKQRLIDLHSLAFRIRAAFWAVKRDAFASSSSTRAIPFLAETRRCRSAGRPRQPAALRPRLCDPQHAAPAAQQRASALPRVE